MTMPTRVIAVSRNPASYSIVILSEGADLEGMVVPEYGPADAYGHRAKSSVAERLAGVRRVVFTSSIVAVGASRRPVLLDESSPWDLGGLDVPYVTTKRQAELSTIQ